MVKDCFYLLLFQSLEALLHTVATLYRVLVVSLKHPPFLCQSQSCTVMLVGVWACGWGSRGGRACDVDPAVCVREWSTE